MAETLSDIMGIKDPFAQNVLKASKAKGEVEAAEKQEKAYGQQEMAKAEAATTEQFAKEREPTELKQKYEKTIDELGQPFIPTQQTAGNLGNIFAMTNILGFLIGGGAKGSAQAALSAQNGMLEGYQKGQQDVYKKQKDIFDENQKSLSKAVEGLRDELKRAADTASVNKELGLAQARQAIANHQAKQMGEYLDKMGVAATYELSEKAWQINEKLKAEKRAEEDRAERRSIEQQRLSLEKENKNKPDYEYVVKDGKTYAVNKRDYKDIHEITGVDFTGATKLGATQKGAGGAVAGQVERMVSAMTQVSGAMKAVADLPVSTSSPTFGQKDFKGLFVAPLSVLNQKMSKETSQMMQSRMVGVARNLASLETGGAATGLAGLTDSIQSGIAIPSGAKLHVALDKLAEMRRIVEDSSRAALSSSKYTEEQKQLIRENLEIVRRAIPFTLQDVRDATVAGQGKSPKISKQDQSLSFTDYVEKYGVGNKKPKDSGLPNKNDKGWELHTDKNGNMAYVGPNGEFEEVDIGDFNGEEY